MAAISNSNSTSASDSTFVTLVSSDGFEFHIRRSAACVSGTIRRMLDMQSNFSEALSGVCHLENISGVVLEKVVEYFYYNEKYRNSESVPDMVIPTELCLEMLSVADYLDT